MTRDETHPLFYAGLTAVFVGYLSVWLPGPAAGLSFLGVEMGEWTKFLGVGLQRNLFYLPPIALGATLALLTGGWPNRRWQTWAMRGLAVGVSLLAFPALEDITGPARAQYLPRLHWIALVGLAALAAGLAARASADGWRTRIQWALIAVLAIGGAALPTWMYLAVRPAVSQVMGTSIGLGIGLWLNIIGQLLVAGVSLGRLLPRKGRPVAELGGHSVTGDEV